MFLRSYVVVRRPFADALAQMTTGAESWMPALARHANGDGDKLLTELGFAMGKRRVARRVEVEVGAPKALGGISFLPIRWRDATDAALFPTLDGELELAPLGQSRTQLGLNANYEPPMGLFGKFADRALFHRVAEVTVKDFLERIGARLERTP